MSSLHSQQIVRLNPGSALVVPERSLSGTVTELPKAMVCGTLSIGHCIKKSPCPSSKRVGYSIQVAGFSYHLIDT